MVSGCEKRGQATLLPLVLLHPFDQHDFRRTTPSDRQEGPSKAAIDVHATAVSHVVALGEPPAAVRQPKRTNRPESPLPSVAVAAEHQVNRMSGLEQVEYVGGMGEQDREAAFDARRNAAGIGTVG